MPLWTLNKPPAPRTANQGKTCVATERGWEDPDTGEVLIAISNLTEKGGASDVLDCAFDATSYAQLDPVVVTVRFNEAVDVVAGATIEASWSGPFGNITLTAAEQLGTQLVEFAGTIPNEGIAGPYDLSIGAQTIAGDIKDAGTATDSNKAISAEAAAAAGEISVP